MKNDARKHVKIFFYVYVWEARFALSNVYVCIFNLFFSSRDCRLWNVNNAYTITSLATF